MYHLLDILCVVAFYALPAILLAGHWLYPWFMPWRLVVLIDAVLGWASILAEHHFHSAYLLNLMRPYGGNPPQELVDQWNDSGFNLVLPLGFLFSLIYLALWVGIYALLQCARRFLQHRFA